MVKEWLTMKTSNEEAEQANLVEDERLGPQPVPFGFQNQRWLEFKGQIQEGDELWEFSSPPETWKNLRGRAGLSIVRNGEIVDSLVTLMS